MKIPVTKIYKVISKMKFMKIIFQKNKKWMILYNKKKMNIKVFLDMEIIKER